VTTRRTRRRIFEEKDVREPATNRKLFSQADPGPMQTHEADSWGKYTRAYTPSLTFSSTSDTTTMSQDKRTKLHITKYFYKNFQTY